MGGAACVLAAVWFGLKLAAMGVQVQPIYLRLGILPVQASGEYPRAL
jgi:hypothetical protein